MITVKEAMERARINGVRIKRSEPGSTEWCVTLNEWSRDMCERAAYYTDCLEDAVLTGAEMRKEETAYRHGSAHVDACV